MVCCHERVNITAGLKPDWNGVAKVITVAPPRGNNCTTTVAPSSESTV